MTDVIERPALDGARVNRDEGFQGFVRTGATVEVKAFTGTTGESGGYAVPREIDAEIARLLKGISPIRSIANVVQVGTAGYRKLVAIGGTPSGWAGETAARPETATPVMSELVPPSGELYANPSASQAMLDDAAFDVEAWLADEIAHEFARAEGAAFVTGSGVNRPKGFLTGPVATTGDAARTFGTLQYLPTGVAGDFGAKADELLVDLVQSLRAPYRQGACFVMNAGTLARVRKMKTGDGQFLWQPGLVAGQPATLLGHPVVEAEDMPDIAANALAIAFGNFREGYLIAERSETQILRDPYTNKPFVSFYATRRVGGCVANSEAIKLLRFAAGGRLSTEGFMDEELPVAAVSAAGAAACALMRTGAGGEEALVDELAAAAILTAERFCGRVLVERPDGAWSGVPAPVRHGVAMLVQHLFEQRGAEAQPPAAVAALWRPYRVMRLSS